MWVAKVVPCHAEVVLSVRGPKNCMGKHSNMEDLSRSLILQRSTIGALPHYEDVRKLNNAGKCLRETCPCRPREIALWLALAVKTEGWQ